MSRAIPTLLLVLTLCSVACGKYGPPERVSAPPAATSADDTDDEKRTR